MALVNDKHYKREERLSQENYIMYTKLICFFFCCLKIIFAKDFFSHVKARQNYLQHSLLHPPPPRTHQTIIIIIGYKGLSDVYYFKNNHLATGVIIVFKGTFHEINRIPVIRTANV